MVCLMGNGVLDGVAGICNWAGYGVFDGCEGYLVLGRVWCA